MGYAIQDIQFKIYPIFCVACALACGIWWQSSNISTSLTLLLLTVVLGAAIALNIACRFKAPILFVYLAFGLLGMYLYAGVVNNQQELIQFIDNKPCNMLGTVVDIQRTSNKYLSYALTVSINMLCHSCDPTRRFKNTFLLRIYTCYGKQLCVSDKIFVDQMMCRCQKNDAFTQYLLKDDIMASAAITDRPISIIERPAWSCLRAIDHYRSYLLNRFQQEMDVQTYRAFASIFLGNMQAKKEETVIKSELRNWGLFHYIARAGLHLVIFISIWVFLLGLLPLPFAIRQIILVLLCTVYFALTWPSIPFNRAFFTFVIVRVCTLLRIRTYYIPALSLVAIGTLLFYPLQLFSLDFQLSFGITYALAWFNEIRVIKA